MCARKERQFPMKLSDIIERKPVKRSKGATEAQQQFRTSLKGRTGRPLVTAYGGTQEGADAALLERIRGPFRGDYTPLCLSFRGDTVLVWRITGAEWVYGFLRDEESQPSRVTMAGWTSRDEVERVARLHLAHINWKEEENSSPILTNQEDQDEFRAWSIKERRRRILWRQLQARGWGDQECFAIIDGFWHFIASARMEALGDPRQIVAAYEENEEMPIQMPFTEER